jgi:RsiW-degrading membrane proteinase PrsW (M82 family)
MMTYQAPYGAQATPVKYHRRAKQQRRGVLAPVLGLVALAGCGLLVFGALRAEVGVPGLLVGTFCALLPVGPVVAAFLWMDRWEPEPPRLLLVAFLWGACFATLAALVLNSVAEAFASLTLGDASAAFGAVFVAPVVEESLKGSFLLGLFWFRRREFDGILDGIVYAGLVAAGFAFTENILYLGRAFTEGASTGQSGGVLAVLILRGVFSPFAHPLFTSMSGIGLGIAANARNGIVRILAPLGGYLLAVTLHGVWNGSASFADGQGLVSVYLLIMVPLFFFIILLIAYQRRREQRIIAAELPGFAAAGWIAPSEVGLLQSLAGRRGWRRAVQQRSGAGAAKAVYEYQGAITELAFLRHKMSRGSVGPEAREWHDELLATAIDARSRAVGMPDALTAAWAQPPPDWVPPPADSRHGPGGPAARAPGRASDATDPGIGLVAGPFGPPGPPPGPPGPVPGPSSGRHPGPWLPSQNPGPPSVPPQRRPPPF